MAMRLLLLSFILLISTYAMGQQLLLSPEVYVSGKSGAVNIVGNVADKTVCFVESSSDFELLWYDSAMRKIAVSNLDFLERGAEKFRFYPTDEGVYIFYQRKRRKQVNLWAAKVIAVDKDTIRPILIDSLALDDGWDKERFTFYKTDFDNRWVYGTSEYDSKNDELSLRATVLDDKLAVIQKVSEQMNDVVYHDVLDMVLDKNDGIHVLYGEPTRRGEQLQNILIGSQKRTAQSMQFAKLDLKGYNIGDGRLMQNKQNGMLYLGGLLYKQDYSTLAALGGFIYDPLAQKWVASNVTPVYRADDARQGVLTNMRLKNLLLKKDGSYSIIMEKSFEETYQRNRSIGFVSPGLGMASSSYNIFHNDEIVVYDISIGGEVIWHETLMKEQETTDAAQRYQSFGMLESSVGNVFLFTDQTNKNNRFINAFLSNDGRLQLKQFTAKGADDIAESGMMLRSAKQTRANEIVFPVIKRGTLSFAKIVF